MYEHKRSRPLPRRHFIARLAWHVAVAGVIVGGSLLAGMAGYAHFESLGPRDAFLNAAMLLGGMGPVNAPQTPNGKVFAGMYALYCGLVFIVVLGLLFVPVLHRLLHLFHLEIDQSE